MKFLTANAEPSWFGILLFSLFSGWTHAQSDTVEQQLRQRIDAIGAAYFYTNPDTLYTLYQEIAHQAAEHDLWYTALEIQIGAVWCALHHQQLDVLPTLIKDAEQTALAQKTALDTLDDHQALRMNIPYSRGLYYVLTGDYQQAIQAYQVITSSQNAHLDSTLIADAYYSLAVSYRNLENYRQAVVYHQRAIEWLSPSAYGALYLYRQAVSYQALGKCYADQAFYSGDTSLLQKSRVLYQQALQLLHQYSDEKARHATLSTYRALADWYKAQNQLDSALFYLQQSVPFQRPPEPELLEIYNLWGEIYVAQQRFPAALEYYYQSLRIVENAYHSRHPQKATILTLLGQSYTAQQQWPQALSYFQQALLPITNDFSDTVTYQNPTQEQLLPNKISLEVLLSKAHTLEQLSESTNDSASLLLALDTYHLAIGVVDQMRQVFPSLEYKQFLSAKSAELYQRAIGAAYRAHTLGYQQRDFLAEAFYFSEKSKAATLLEATKTAEARAFAGVPDTLLEQENQLKRESTFWENKLYQVADDSAEQTVRREVFATREAYHALIKHLEQTYPDYHRLKYSTKVIGLRKLQKTLPTGTTLLAFSYGDSSLYTFSINQRDVQLYATEVDSTFRQSLDRVLRHVSQYDYQQDAGLARYQAFVQDAYALYQKLLSPVAPFPGSDEQLIIIPDGPLGYLPFDVLLTDTVAPNTIRYQTLPYLIRQFPIRYDYSATLLTTPPPPSSNHPTGYLGFAPVYASVASLDSNDATDDATGKGNSREVRATLDGQVIGLSPLHYNRAEVDYAAALFDGKIFAGAEASEEQFKQHASEASLLHLSMHAYAHDEDENLSGLIFTQQADTTQEDGFLHPNELYGLSLRAELAVLSACETGVGTLAQGEGIMSLGRAFKYAGCPNVTMSLWKADDQSTHRLIQAFFTHLRAGQPKDEALRQAKLAYLSQAKSVQAHPYYWAAFVQVGDDLSLMTTHRGEQYWWWIMGSVMLSSGVLFWLYRRYFSQGRALF